MNINNKKMKNSKNTNGMNSKYSLLKKKQKNPVSHTDQPMITSPQIDKLAVVVDTPVELHGLILHELICSFQDGDGTCTELPTPKGYNVSLMVNCPNGDGELLKGNAGVWLTATAITPKPHLRLEFNPIKLFGTNEECFEKIKSHLDHFFLGICGVGFFDLLAHGRVSNIEICRHILQRKPDDYLFRVKYARSQQSIFGSDGGLETLYFGKRAGNQTCIYNKAKQLHGNSAENDCIRIERRLKPKNTKIVNLWGLANPFKHVSIFSLKANKLPNSITIGHWIAFQDACRYRGVNQAIKCQPKFLHTKLKKIVSDNPVDWWDIADTDWEYLLTDALNEAWLDHVSENPTQFSTATVIGDGIA